MLFNNRWKQRSVNAFGFQLKLQHFDPDAYKMNVDIIHMMGKLKQ